jgi:hypothetical protein
MTIPFSMDRSSFGKEAAFQSWEVTGSSRIFFMEIPGSTVIPSS